MNGSSTESNILYLFIATSRDLCMRIFPRQDPTVNNRPCKHHKQGFEFGKSGRLRLCPSTQVPVVSAVSFLDQGWLRPPFSAFLYPRRAVPCRAVPCRSSIGTVRPGRKAGSSHGRLVSPVNFDDRTQRLPRARASD
jgi:hypothetical protein